MSGMKPTLYGKSCEDDDDDGASERRGTATDFKQQSSDSTKTDSSKLKAVESQGGTEVVCGPVELSKHVDLSATQGIIPLTSIRLLKAKSKSFLLHLKAKSCPDKSFDKAASQVISITFNLMFSINCVHLCTNLPLCNKVVIVTFNAAVVKYSKLLTFYQ